MATKFVPDAAADDYVPNVDRHFYENQVPPGGPGNDTSFARAAAAAKDRARHQLIKAVLKADQDARRESFTGFGDTDVDVKRTVDGIAGAPDDAIKL